MEGYSVDALQVGQSASFSKTITEHDVYTFAGVTGDLNPAHINERYARETQFHGRIAHGMLSAGLISAVIGERPCEIHLEDAHLSEVMQSTLRHIAPLR